MNKPKTWLATALIEAGVTKFPEGTNWAAQDKCDLAAVFSGERPTITKGRDMHFCNASRVSQVKLSALNPRWHQTVLSRDEFDRFVAETVPRSTAVGDDETSPATKEELEALTTVESPEQRAKLARIYAPTLDQLLQDWCNADDFAQRKQTEADEASAMRDERWQAVQARAGEMGVMIGSVVPVVSEPELVITDWRDLRVGDIIQCIGYWEREDTDGKEFTVTRLKSVSYEGDKPIRIEVQGVSCPGTWGGEYRFIRRP